jgi:molybdenum cofactor cytidylyltransferase
VRALNRLHESLTLATVAPFEIVEARQMLATVKVIPFAVPRPSSTRRWRSSPPSRWSRSPPSRRTASGLVITVLPHTRPQLIEKTKTAIAARLEALGSRLGEVEEAPHTIAGVAMRGETADRQATRPC